MKPITEYTDFRQLMLDYYEDRKRRSAFSWRDFSKAAGFTSSSYMKVVCDGKSKLSKIGVERTGVAMGLVGFEMEYFRALVEFGQAGTEDKKKAAYERMLSIAKVHKVRVMEGDLFEFYDSWQNPVVRELAPLMPGALPGDIAKKIKHEFTAQEVRDALKLLVKLNILKTQSKDVYKQTDKIITGSSESLALALRSMNRQMIDLAREAIEKIKPAERNISGVTVGVDAKALKRITDEVDRCRKQVIAIAGECDNADQVYRLNLQLFPLTERI